MECLFIEHTSKIEGKFDYTMSFPTVIFPKGKPTSGKWVENHRQFPQKNVYNVEVIVFIRWKKGRTYYLTCHVSGVLRHTMMQQLGIPKSRLSNPTLCLYMSTGPPRQVKLIFYSTPTAYKLTVSRLWKCPLSDKTKHLILACFGRHVW